VEVEAEAAAWESALRAALRATLAELTKHSPTASPGTYRAAGQPALVPNLVFAPSALDFDGGSSVAASSEAQLTTRRSATGAATERSELQAVVEEQRAVIRDLQRQMEAITAHVQSEMPSTWVHPSDLVLENLSESGFSVRSNPRFEEDQAPAPHEGQVYKEVQRLETILSPEKGASTPMSMSRTAEALHAASLLADDFEASPFSPPAEVRSPYLKTYGVSTGGQQQWVVEEDLVDLEPVPEGDEDDDDYDDLRLALGEAEQAEEVLLTGDVLDDDAAHLPQPPSWSATPIFASAVQRGVVTDAPEEEEEEAADSVQGMLGALGGVGAPA
jgi:hypothetical protein